ncbi:hypothetical protein [Enterobacter cloacae]|uniref:hypothetical protein n=1 Tax=Enterobacter cloacae TaxID=550 RepID=UPI0020757463|nr:hypothetical protein [Enterobacter cloacae]MCM7137134.1 hypothetical protein [Enterobacter cloacae]
MSKITKELAQSVSDLKAGYTLGHTDVAILNELARIALASLEAEAVCVIDQSNLDYLKSGSDADVWPASRTEMGDVLLYRASPPAPVSVPDESAVELLATDLMKMIDKITGERHSVATLSSLRVSIVEACRDAMLQGAENAESPTTMQTAPALDSSPKIAESPSGNSPVIPDGWKLVPVEPTAEMLQSGISAHNERSQIQIHDRPAPGPMECAYVAMIAAAPQQEVKS